MRSLSPAGGPTHTPIVSYTLYWLPDWGRRLTQTFFTFCHTVACTGRRTGGCGKSMRMKLFSRPLRSAVTRLISAPCKSSSGRRKYIPGTAVLLVPCSEHQYDISSSRRGCPCRMTSSQNAVSLRTKPGTNALPPARASHAGACHGNRRSGSCIGSLSASAQTGNVGEGWRIVPVSTHPRSSAEELWNRG